MDLPVLAEGESVTEAVVWGRDVVCWQQDYD
jgi:hypothetical protein